MKSTHVIHKINLKLIKDLNMTPIPVKLLEENREKLHDISLVSDFLNTKPKAQTTETKIDR